MPRDPFLAKLLNRLLTFQSNPEADQRFEQRERDIAKSDEIDDFNWTRHGYGDKTPFGPMNRDIQLDKEGYIPPGLSKQDYERINGLDLDHSKGWNVEDILDYQRRVPQDAPPSPLMELYEKIFEQHPDSVIEPYDYERDFGGRRII